MKDPFATLTLDLFRQTIFLPVILCAAATVALGQAAPVEQHVRIKNNVFVAAGHPKIEVKLDPKLKYLGKFPFDIMGVAGGYRYIWGEMDHGKHLRRTFIIQMEGYYPSNKHTYEYGTPNPFRLGSHDYQHNVWVYDNDESIKERPGNESDLTKRFMQENGYEWEHELVMSRYARVADESKKNEIILFYFENLKDYTAHPAKSFPDERPGAEQEKIQDQVDANSKKAIRAKD